MITLDDNRMLELWREGAGLEPQLADASIERFDAFNVNGRLRMAMRAWYLDYLTNAPLHLVPVSDLSEFARLTPGPAQGQWTLRLLCDSMRITSVSIQGLGSLLLVDPDNPDHTARLPDIANRFTRKGCSRLAFHRPHSSEVIINLESETPPILSSVKGVRATDDDLFIVDERVLIDIPPLARKAISF